MVNVEGFNLLQNGSILKANNAMYSAQVGTWWPVLPMLGIIISIRLITKSDAITAFVSLFILAIAGSLDISDIVLFHPIIYVIMVITTGLFLFRTFYHGD